MSLPSSRLHALHRLRAVRPDHVLDREHVAVEPDLTSRYRLGRLRFMTCVGNRAGCRCGWIGRMFVSSTAVGRRASAFEQGAHPSA